MTDDELTATIHRHIAPIELGDLTGARRITEVMFEGDRPVEVVGWLFPDSRCAAIDDDDRCWIREPDPAGGVPWLSIWRHGVCVCTVKRGKIDATIAKLSTGREIDINGVNGNTTLRFIGDVNADVEAHGHNGRVESDLPNLQENKDERHHGRYSARIGTGGPQIEINGVNGNVFLTKAEKQGAATAKTATK